jgi:hypothetical protein
MGSEADASCPKSAVSTASSSPCIFWIILRRIFMFAITEWRAVVRIGDWTLIEGNLPTRVSGLIREWAASHREELQANWARARDRRPLMKIAPLD